MNVEAMTIGLGITLVLMSAAHDHLHSLGERKTTFFKWTGTNFSPLMQWVGILRKGDAKTKAKAKQKR